MRLTELLFSFKGRINRSPGGWRPSPLGWQQASSPGSSKSRRGRQVRPRSTRDQSSRADRNFWGIGWRRRDCQYVDGLRPQCEEAARSGPHRLVACVAIADPLLGGFPGRSRRRGSAGARAVWYALAGAAGFAAFVISVWLFVQIGFLRGTGGPNRFGPDPLGAMTSDAKL